MIIEGRSERDWRVPVKTFVRAAESVSNLLAQVGDDRSTNDVKVEWFVRELRQGSTVLVVEPIPDSSEVIDAANQDASVVLRGISSIARGEDVRGVLSYPAVESIRTLSGLLLDGAGSVKVGGVAYGRDVSIVVTKETTDHAKQLLTRRHRSSGSVEGTIETLSVHERRPYFNVFHPLDGYAIKCRCDEALFAQARVALRRRVRVVGEILRRFDGRAETVEVEEIRVLPSRTDLPQPDDIRGILAGLPEGPVEDIWLRGVNG